MKLPAVLIPLVTLFLVTGCNTLKDTYTKVASGNYERAIDNAVQNLRKSRTKKNSQEYMLLLEEAFAKAVARDRRTVERLERDGSVRALEDLYRVYVKLSDRQEYIRPLLPLYIADQGRDAQFDFVDYTDAIFESRDRFSEGLYREAERLLQSGDRIDARIAYEKFNHLDAVNPNYKDTRVLTSQAHYQGTNFVQVVLVNDSGIALPQRLENDLLDLEAYKMNSLWTVYHSAPVENIEYDYEMLVAIRQISVSPERVHEREIVQERKVRDGYDYTLDRNGNVMKDENGNDIKTERFATVLASILEFSQSKSARVSADIEYRPFHRDQVLEHFSITSESVFKHEYCSHSGDERALNDHYRKLSRSKPRPFPSNEQMIYDTGEDLKKQLRNIASKNRF